MRYEKLPACLSAFFFGNSMAFVGKSSLISPYLRTLVHAITGATKYCLAIRGRLSLLEVCKKLQTAQTNPTDLAIIIIVVVVHLVSITGNSIYSHPIYIDKYVGLG